jgi:hypothetical protein
MPVSTSALVFHVSLSLCATSLSLPHKLACFAGRDFRRVRALLRVVIKNHASADAAQAGTHDLSAGRNEERQGSALAA